MPGVADLGCIRQVNQFQTAKKHRDKAVHSRFPEICQRFLVRILVNENLSADFEFFFHGDCPAVEGLSVRGKHVVGAIMIRWLMRDDHALRGLFAFGDVGVDFPTLDEETMPRANVDLRADSATKDCPIVPISRAGSDVRSSCAPGR